MIIQALIIALIVLAIHYTMQKGEIFGWLGKFFEKMLPSWMHSPVYECNVCMCPYYGTILYTLIYHNSVKEWLIVVIIAMGFNVLFNKWEPKDVE